MSYTRHFSSEQITCIRNLVTSEEQMHRMLVLVYDQNLSISAAQETIKALIEGSFCPNCRKDLSGYDKQRNKRRHINSCEKKALAKQATPKPRTITTEPEPSPDQIGLPNQLSSLPSSQTSPTTPATNLSSSLLLSPPRSPKRRLDDVDGLSSGNEGLKLSFGHSAVSVGQRATSSIAKRPKTAAHLAEISLSAPAQASTRSSATSRPGPEKNVDCSVYITAKDEEHSSSDLVIIYKDHNAKGQETLAGPTDQSHTLALRQKEHLSEQDDVEQDAAYWEQLDKSFDSEEDTDEDDVDSEEEDADLEDDDIDLEALEPIPDAPNDSEINADESANSQFFSSATPKETTARLYDDESEISEEG